MKKILLTSICLLALTACSQGQAEKGKASTTSSQSTSQVKTKKKRTFKPKLSPQNLTITIKTKFKSATKR